LVEAFTIRQGGCGHEMVTTSLSKIRKKRLNVGPKGNYWSGLDWVHLTQDTVLRPVDLNTNYLTSSTNTSF
jgi:hypothetical protein